MTLEYAQPTESSVIFFDTLSEWQKDFLNSNLRFEDMDTIGNTKYGGHDKVIFNTNSESLGWLVAGHDTTYQTLQFNDIFIEEL